MRSKSSDRVQRDQKTIALYFPSLHGGGAERVMLTLAYGFTQEGFPVDLVLARAEGPYLSQLPDNARLIDLKSSSVTGSLPGLISYLKREKPQVLLSTLAHSNIAALWAKKISGVRIRLTIREANMITESTSNALSFKDRIMPFLMRFCYPWADSIIAVSKGVADDLVETVKVPSGKVRVIYNPIDLEYIAQKAGEPLYHPWFVNKKIPVIIGVGRLTAAKDFSTLLRAFAIVRKQLVSRLVILGEGPERRKLENIIKELGLDKDAVLLGYADNPFTYMHRSSVFVLSSAWEGLPNVLIQAIALGTPVVATDCPSGPAEILENGAYGPLVPVGDIQALAGAIISVLGLPVKPEDLKKRALAFSSERICKEYLEVIL